METQMNNEEVEMEAQQESVETRLETAEEIVATYAFLEKMSDADLGEYLEAMNPADRKRLYSAAAKVAMTKMDEFEAKFKDLVSEYDIIFIGSFAKKTPIGPVVKDMKNTTQKDGSSAYKLLICAEKFLERVKDYFQ